MARIPLRELRRFQREVSRFMSEVEKAYGAEYASERIIDRIDAMAETVRNAATAEAYIDGWIGVRERLHRDPDEVG